MGDIHKHNSLSRQCCIPGCQSGKGSDRKRLKSEGKSQISVFGVKNNPTVLKLWNEVIPKSNGHPLTSNCSICALHFHPEDIMKFFETRLKDGFIDRIPRDRPTLREGAIPIYFPWIIRSERPIKLDEQTDKKRHAWLTPVDTNNEGASNAILTESHANEETINNDNFILETSLVKSEVKSELEEDSFSINELINDNKIETPSKYWAKTYIEGKNEVVFAEWDESYCPKKKLVIASDMSFKVLFGVTELELNKSFTKITKLEDVEDVIRTMHQIELPQE